MKPECPSPDSGGAHCVRDDLVCILDASRDDHPPICCYCSAAVVVQPSAAHEAER